MSRAPTGRMQNLFKNNRSVFEAALKKKVTPYESGKEVTPGSLCRWKPSVTRPATPPMRRIRPGMTGIS